MYIDLLKQYASDIKSVKFQPAVMESDISKAEKRLNILFPDELKNLLSNQPLFFFNHEEYTARNVAADIAELIKLYYQDQI